MPKLDLRGTAIIDSENLEKVPSGEEVVEDVRARMHASGIPEMSPPRGEPPVSLTDVDTASMSLRDLENLFIKYTGYAQFISTIAAERVAALNAEQTRLKSAKARIAKMLMEEGVTKADIAAARDAHPDVEDISISILRTRTERDMVEAARKAFSGQAAALSRIVEIRKLEYEQGSRQGTLNKKLQTADRLNRRKMRKMHREESD